MDIKRTTFNLFSSINVICLKYLSIVILFRLDELLRNELIDKFIAELSCVCIPQLYFNYHVGKIIQQANSYKSAKEKITNFIGDFTAKRKSSEHFNIIDSSVKRLGDIINSK